MSVESILLAVTQIYTFQGRAELSRATGSFFERNNQLFLITNRHVLRDDASSHRPDRIEIDLHIDAGNISRIRRFSIPLYQLDGRSTWVEARDSGGLVDVVALPLESSKFPQGAEFRAFTEANLLQDLSCVEVGQSVRVVGFPLGFRDALHNLPVMRHAIIASSFSLRFQGNGYFLTDSLLHRGASGSPVVLRVSQRSGREDFPWFLLGVHSARINGAQRDVNEDDRLNLFSAWYADVLMTLTQAAA